MRSLANCHGRRQAEDRTRRGEGGGILMVGHLTYMRVHTILDSLPGRNVRLGTHVSGSVQAVLGVDVVFPIRRTALCSVQVQSDAAAFRG